MSRILSLSRTVAMACALFLLAGSLGLWAEDAPEASPPAFNFGMTAALGTETISGENFQSFGLIPDFGFGPLGVGIDFSFHFRFYETPGGTFGIYPRAKDWWDSDLSTGQNVDKYLSRLLYVRWGHKGDPLYIQAGLLPTTTLGTGFLVGGYNNGALRPSLKYTGLEVDASGSLIGLPYGGFESFVGNISTFDVLGARAYVKPFGLTNPDNAFLKEVQFGLTVAADTNPYAQAVTKGSGSVFTAGLDTMVPLMANDFFTAVATADAAVQGSHTGGSIGVGGKAFGFFRWGLQNRLLGDNFLPSYFDRGYEINRVSKYKVFSSSTVIVPGTFGWLASLGTSFLDDQLAMGVVLSGPWTAQTQLYAKPQLQGFATVKVKGLPISLDSFYVKNGLGSMGDLLSAENALIGAKVGYNLGAVTLSVVYDLRYLNDGEKGPNNSNWVSTSRVETSVKF